MPAAPAFARRAAEALYEIPQHLEATEPLRFEMLRLLGALDAPAQLTPVFDFLEKRVPGNPRSESRYRWELTHRVGVKHPVYAPSERTWTAWREGDAQQLARDPFELEAKLLVPIVLASNLEVLLTVAGSADSVAPRAAALLAEAAPIARRDIARYIAANDSWEDTFALWCITRMPRVLDMLHSLAVALAVSYAAGRQGPVLGNKYPYYDRPLVSASAHLAAALLEIGLELEVVTTLVAYVREQQRTSGGWGDDETREDPLTTFVAADLLARTDPTFDLAPTIDYFERTQGSDGLWRALGPEAPWLTGQIAMLVCAASRPFSARFRWPHCGRSVMDQKTGIPFFAHFLDITNLLARLPGLAAAPVELGFIDLIGFRAFNNRFGQDAGDDVLRMFATELRTIPIARAIRDGGDEFLVVGAPGRVRLAEDLAMFMTRWRRVFGERYGADVLPVLPRIVVGRAQSDQLRELRQRLGREITGLKDLVTIPDTGVLVNSAG
jgi:GGDEF domain-containing protein